MEPREVLRRWQATQRQAHTIGLENAVGCLARTPARSNRSASKILMIVSFHATTAARCGMCGGPSHRHIQVVATALPGGGSFG
jgi:hypothetical protein